MPRDPILDLAAAIERVSVERVASSAAKRIAKAIDRRFATGEAPQASGKLRRNTVVDGASDGILVRNQLPYAAAHQAEIIPPAKEMQAEVREAFKDELGGLPKW